MFPNSSPIDLSKITHFLKLVWIYDHFLEHLTCSDVHVLLRSAFWIASLCHLDPLFNKRRFKKKAMIVFRLLHKIFQCRRRDHWASASTDNSNGYKKRQFKAVLSTLPDFNCHVWNDLKNQRIEIISLQFPAMDSHQVSFTKTVLCKREGSGDNDRIDKIL